MNDRRCYLEMILLSQHLIALFQLKLKAYPHLTGEINDIIQAERTVIKEYRALLYV